MPTREEILRQTELPRRAVATPEWGAGTAVTVRGLTGAERDQWEAQTQRLGTLNVRARLVVMGAIDEEGQRLFKDEDAAQLGETSAAPLDRLFDAVCELSGVALPNLKALRKNLRAGQGAGSSSDSPLP